jgi:adenosylmethionine-8-amino-7-oxononanoate aminotransferase
MLEEKRHWVETDRKYVWHAMSGYDPEASTMVVTEGEGAWISDTDGNRFLDGMSGLWCVIDGCKESRKKNRDRQRRKSSHRLTPL